MGTSSLKIHMCLWSIIYVGKYSVELHPREFAFLEFTLPYPIYSFHFEKPLDMIRMLGGQIGLVDHEHVII